MTVTWKEPSDPQRLKELVAATGNAKQRDRYRVVLLAGRIHKLDDCIAAFQSQYSMEKCRRVMGSARLESDRRADQDFA